LKWFLFVTGRRNKALKALQFGLTLTPGEVELKNAVTRVNAGNNSLMADNLMQLASKIFIF